jgi:hypothetical protein
MKFQTREEDHLFEATIKTDDFQLDGVRCKLYLPVKLADPISLVFSPTVEQARILSDKLNWKFSFYGELNHGPDYITQVYAEKVYTHGLSTKWVADVSESVLTAEPVDLQVDVLRPLDSPDLKEKIHGRFRLTPNELLTPAQTVLRSDTGNVSVETLRNIKFVLPNAIQLSFMNRYRFQKGEGGDTVSFHELVAEFEAECKAGVAPDLKGEVLGLLEDLLRLASLAARQRCVCLEYDVVSERGYTEYYRRDVTIPPLKAAGAAGRELVEQADFEEFLYATYHKFIEMGRNDLVRKAVDFAIPKEGQIFEGSFMSLYSALETLVLYFRRENNLEMVFSDDEEVWSQIKADLMLWLKNYPKLKDDKGKRALLYENLPALTRISFKTAFLKCCDFYSVDLHDLWPVLGNAEGWSLSTIRNKLVHGEYFNRQQLRALISASEHLRWTVERLILSILGWDTSRSNVSADMLSFRNQYKYWEADRKLLSS